jgi:hypothetical protein
MYNGTVGAQAYKRRSDDWIVGSTYQGCDTEKGNLVTCKFSRNGSAFNIIYTENGARARFTKLRGSPCATADGCLPPLTRNSHRTVTPVLVK